MLLRLASFDESPYRLRTPRKLGKLHVHGEQGVGYGSVSRDGAGGSYSLHAARGERRRVSVWAMRNAGISSAVGTRESIKESVSNGPSASYFSSSHRALLYRSTVIWLFVPNPRQCKVSGLAVRIDS